MWRPGGDDRTVTCWRREETILLILTTDGSDDTEGYHLTSPPRSSELSPSHPQNCPGTLKAWTFTDQNRVGNVNFNVRGNLGTEIRKLFIPFAKLFSGLFSL